MQEKSEKTLSQEELVKLISGGEKFVKTYVTTAKKINNIFLPQKDSRTKLDFNLFNTNVNTLASSMFARLPQPAVSRRFSDPRDQIGRVASLILERVLHFEISSSSNFRDVSKQVLQDYLVGGAGWMVATYSADVENPILASSSEKDDLAEGSIVIKNQNLGVEYASYKDVIWSPARSWSEVSFWARRVWMTEEDFKERFGSKIAKKIEFEPEERDRDANPDVCEKKVGVWELWNKEDRKVYFCVKTLSDVLDVIDDPFGLPEFFPTTPFFANVNNDTFLPIPDFVLQEKQYRNIDELGNRIDRISRATRVAGIYDAQHPEVRQLLETEGDLVMVPMESFSSFAQKGGLDAAFSMLPINDLASVSQQLSAYKGVETQQLETISGISDLVRGSGGNPYESAAASRMKSQYASVRLGAKTNEFAQVLTYIIKCYAHFVCKFFTVEQIQSRIGKLAQEDEQYFNDALQILGNELTRHFMIEVSSDSIQSEDFARDTAEKVGVLQQLASYIPQAIQGSQQVPELAPVFFSILSWVVSGTRGAREIEGVIETAMQQYNAAMVERQKNPQEPKPDPAIEQINAQIQMHQMSKELDQIKLQQDAQLAMQKLQQEMQLAQMKLQMENDMKTKELELKAQELQIEQMKLELMRDETEAKLLVEAQRLKMQEEHFYAGMTPQELPPTA